MRTFDKVIINCAVTGGDQVPSQSPHIPITPEEIAREAIDAANAGASIVHIHARDPETGEPSSDPELFIDIATRIGEECDAIVLPTTGGAINQSLEERIQVVPALEPEMATCNLGSINYG